MSRKGTCIGATEAMHPRRPGMTGIDGLESWLAIDGAKLETTAAEMRPRIQAAGRALRKATEDGTLYSKNQAVSDAYGAYISAGNYLNEATKPGSLERIQRTAAARGVLVEALVPNPPLSAASRAAFDAALGEIDTALRIAAAGLVPDFA